MQRGRFDECCIHCGEKIEDVYGAFEASDYKTNFEFDCPHCEKNIEVVVHLVPEFEIVDPNYMPPWVQEELMRRNRDPDKLAPKLWAEAGVEERAQAAASASNITDQS